MSLDLGIARLCCDPRRAVRSSAFGYLQRSILLADLHILSAVEWESVFNKVLFPLLLQLLETSNIKDHIYGIEETRIRVSQLLCRMFLQHLTPLLTLSTFTTLWLTILDFMDKYSKLDQTDMLVSELSYCATTTTTIRSIEIAHLSSSSENQFMNH